MQKLDKKQIPQFVGLCVLSTGTFGYFGLRMVTPSPAAAATRPALKPSEPAEASAAKTAAAPAGTVADAVADAVAPPPTPGMRDPFVVGCKDPKTAAAPGTLPAFAAPLHGPAPAASPQVADAQIHEQVSALPPAPVSELTMPGFPAAPPLPPAASVLPPQKAISEKIMPLPAPPPAPPKWSVTGLLQGEDGAGVAILRDGESRRIVHVGDFIDGMFRVTRVTRSEVILRHGTTFYTLPLGTKPDSKPEAPTAPTAPPLSAAPAPIVSAPAVPAPAAPPLPRQSQAAPVPAQRLPAETVAAALPLRLLDGTEMAVNAAPRQQMASLVR